MPTRVQIIEETLIYHGKRKTANGLECGCGYRYRLGESIQRHRAEIVDAALTYAENET